jgi:hypothetical protein
MLWTPDELPEIESWLKLWSALLILSVSAGCFGIVQLRRGIPSPQPNAKA